MPLSQEEVASLATYAHIALSTDELEEMTDYLNETLELLEPLRQMDLDGVEPSFYPSNRASNVLRQNGQADPADRGLSREAALVNAGTTRDGAFRVPSILGSEEDV